MSSYRKLSLTILSTILIILIVFTLPLQVAATSLATADEMSLPEANEEISYNESEEIEASIIGEDKTKRDEYTKHFLTNAGTTIIAQYAVPVHYKNSDGEYVDFDNSLITSEATVSYSTQDEATADETSTYNLRTTQETVQTEEIFINKKSDSKVSYFKKSGKAKLIEISRDGHTISWGYSGASVVTAEAKNNSPQKPTGNDAYLTLQNLSSTVLYENIYNNIDLEVINSTAGVKENIILKTSNAKNVFNIEYSIGDLTAESIDSRTIALKDTEGKVVYTITAPYMMDTKGAQSEALELKILKDNKGKLSVKLTADKTWLKDSSRAYPVTIDPSFMYGQDLGNTVYCAYVSSDSENSKFASEGSVYVGRPGTNSIKRTVIQLRELPELNIGDMLVNATFAMNQVNINSAADTYIGLYEIPDIFKPSDIKWSNSMSCSSEITDYIKIPKGTKEWRMWDITELVKEWYDNYDSNISDVSDEGVGFYLKMMNEANTYFGMQFTSTLYPTSPGYRPAFVLTYRNNKGLESYWDYTAISAGTAGTIHINDYSGNLVFQTSIANTASPKYPANLVYTYNSYMADADYNFYTSYAGKGWKMNYQATVLDSAVFGLEDEFHRKYPSVYTDADGTDHYFQTITDQNSENYNKELDEDGLNLELVPINSMVKVIIDENKNSIYFDSSGKITHMTDSSDNRIDLTYSSNDFISEITDADDNVITIQDSNNDNLIDSICDPSNRATTMSYNSSDYLTSITRPDGNTVQFSYNSDGLLTKVTDIDGSYIVFTYEDNETRGVKTVQEFDADDNPGQTLAFDRTKHNTTVMQSSGADCVFDTNDDILTTYQYDNLGRTTSVSAKTKNGKDLGAASATYTSGINSTASNIKSQNRVTQSYSMGANKENLVVNHNLENLTGWTVSDFDTQSGLNTAALSTEQKLYGAKSLKFNVASTILDTRDTLYQDISFAYLSAGATYTLSAYVNVTSVTPSANASDYGAVLFADLYTSGTSYTTSVSNYISNTTESSINSGFRRLSTTFTVPENISKIRVYLAFVSATGTAYFDGVQLEKSDAPSNYNLLENASLERGEGSTVPASWIGSNLTMSNSYDTYSTGHVDGNKSFRIRGEVTKRKNIYQDVPVTSGDTEKETYILSGWATAHAVPKETNGSFFRLLARVYFTDGTYKNNNIYFNTTLAQGNWQYATAAFTLSDGTNTDKTPDFIRVYLSYDMQGNYAYFDNLSLTKEAVPSYTYNEDGDLVSVVANAEQDSSYEYADNRLTEYVDPKSNSYTYEYDEDTKLLTSATTQKGATYTYTYDDYGNAKEVVGSADGLDSLKGEITYTYPTEDSTTYSVTAKDQDKNTSTEVYDKSTGTLQSVTDTKGIITKYTYDSDTDRVLSTIKNNNQSVEYTYDDFGRRTGISHEGTNYYFTYDAFGNRINTKVGSRVLSTNTYAPYNGSLTQTTYGNGAAISYTYDVYGNYKTVSYNGTKVSENFTDSAGNINRTQDLLTNLEHRVTYDFTGRLISKEVLNLSATGDRWHRSLEYDYDLNNNVSRFAYADRNGSNITQFAYGLDNLLEKTTLQNEKEVTYDYDAFGRLTGKLLNTSTPLNYAYTYEVSDWGADFTTTKIECETIGDTTYKYTYDEYGNITDIIRVNADNTKTLLCTYYYDTYNQLTTVIDYENLEQCSYAYNLAGNITKRIKYKLGTSHNIVSRLEDISYSYGDSEWKDLLTSYGGQTITYDAIGNPLTYRDDITMTWQNGRELATYSDDNYDITYTYDASGMRTGKTSVFGTTINNYNYVYEGGQLLQMNRNNYIYDFCYDANGTPIGFKYTNPSGVATQYYYGTNSRGDIVAVYHATGSKLATYSYDAYGKPLATTFNSSSPSATIQNAINNNPLRYRGYVYDSETGFYYLQTRYYDPTTCRFINADGYCSTGQGITGNNMYAYCGNNPISHYDPTGTHAIGDTCGDPTCAMCRPERREFLNSHIDWYNDIMKCELVGVTYNGLLIFEYDDNYRNPSSSLNVVVIDNYFYSENPGVRIHNSHIYKDEITKNTVVAFLLVYQSGFFGAKNWERTHTDMIVEWKAHNDVYNVIQNESCEHVDFDYNDRGKSYTDYLDKAVMRGVEKYVPHLQ